MKEKLLAIQQELKAPKNQYNSFGKYNYRSAEDILEAVKPLLVKHKVILTLRDELRQIGERYYIEATVMLSDIEKDENIVSVAFAREEENKKGMDGSQITGTASSYARKYALNGLFLIDDTKDSDATNKHEVDEEELKEAILSELKKITDIPKFVSDSNKKKDMIAKYTKLGLKRDIVISTIKGYLDAL